MLILTLKSYLFIWNSNLTDTPYFYLLAILLWMGLSWWLSGKESACNAGDPEHMGWIPGSGRSPGWGHGNPLQCSCLKNPMDRGAWWVAVHRGGKSWTQPKQLRRHVTLNTTKGHSFLHNSFVFSITTGLFLKLASCLSSSHDPSQRTSEKKSPRNQLVWPCSSTDKNRRLIKAPGLLKVTDKDPHWGFFHALLLRLGQCWAHYKRAWSIASLN